MSEAFKFTLYETEMDGTDPEGPAKGDEIEVEYELPGLMVVCHRCRGRGKHTNPSIDGNGITESEMEEAGPDFQEDYMNGVYDIQCSVCHGERVMLEVDAERCYSDEQKALLKRYRAHLREQRQMEAEDRNNERMGY